VWPGVQTMTGTETLTAGAVGKHFRTSLTSGAPASPAAAGVTAVSTVCLCRLWRQGSVDTLAGDVSPVHVGIHCQWDQPGSRTITVK
jgi:hypothetical protein